MLQGDHEQPSDDLFQNPPPFAIQLKFPHDVHTVRENQRHVFRAGEGQKEHATLQYIEGKKVYELEALPNMTCTWLEVGRYVPPLHTEWPPEYAAACILRQYSVFLIGGFECHVVRCPPIRQKDARRYRVAPVIDPVVDSTPRTVAEEIYMDEHATLTLNIISKRQYHNQVEYVHYGRGGHFTTIGTGSGAHIQLPADHLSAGQLDAVHCRILCIGGCFWLIDGDQQRSSTGTYVLLRGIHEVTSTSPSLLVLMGDSDEPKASFRIAPFY
jgi:hypothetical protein